MSAMARRVIETWVQGSKTVSLKFLAMVFPPRTVVAALAAGLCCDSRRLVRAHADRDGLTLDKLISYTYSYLL